MPQFTIYRQNWRPLNGQFIRLPGRVPVSTHATREQAEKEADRLTEVAWSSINPFRMGLAYSDVLTVPVPLFSDWLTESGFSTPELNASRESWAKWWEDCYPNWSDEERISIRSRFGKIALYEAVPEQGDSYFAVGEHTWHRHYDSYDNFSGEAAQFTGLFTTFHKVEDHRQIIVDNRIRLLTNEAIEYAYEYIEDMYVQHTIWSQQQPLTEKCVRSNRYLQSFENQSLDVITVANQIADPASKQYFSVDRTVFVNAMDLTTNHSTQTVAVFSSRKQAEQYAWECDFAERPFLNPFRYCESLSNCTSIHPVGLQAVLNQYAVEIPIDHYERTLSDSGTPKELAQWWDHVSLWFNHETHDAIWDLMDQLRFYTVRSITID